MPKTDAVIGRVSVRVLPDTTKFKEKAKQQLRKIEKQLKVKVDVVPELDGKKVEAQARELQARLNTILRDIDVDVDVNSGSALVDLHKVREQMDEMDAKSVKLRLNPASVRSVTKALDEVIKRGDRLNDIEMKVKLDREGIDDATATLHRRLVEAARVNIQVDRENRSKFLAQVDRLFVAAQDKLSHVEWAPELDQRRWQRELREMESALDRIRNLRLEIRPGMDTLARARVEAEIARLEERVHTIQSDIKPEVEQTRFAIAAAKLAVLARDRVVNLGVRVRSAGLAGLGQFALAMTGLRGFNEVFGNVLNGLLRLDIIAPKLGALALGIAGLGLTAISATGNLLSFGASLASIAPLALALPGLILGAGIAVGTLVAAFKDFGTIFPDVKEKFSALQDIISERFWAKAQAPMRALIDSTFPLMERGFARVADAAGGFFGALASDVQTTLGQRLDGWFDGVAGGFANLTKYTGAFTNIFGVLGTLGTGLMPRLADAVGRVATRWSDWLTQAEQTGRLNELVDIAIQAVKDLGRVVGNLGGIFAGLARAAQKAGGSTLKTLADNLERLNRIVNSDRFQEGLVGTFKAAYDAMERIRTKAGPGVMLFFSQLANVIQDIGPKVGDSIGMLLDGLGRALSNPAIRKGIDDLFTGIRDAASLIGPALDKLAPAIGSIGSLLGDFVRLFGEGLAQALGYVGPFLREVADGIRPLVDALNGPIRDIVDAIGPGLVELGTNLKELFSTAAEKVGDFWQAAKPFVEKGLKEAMQGIADGVKGIKEAAEKIDPETIRVLGQFIGKLVELAGSAINKTLSGLGPLLGGVADGGNKAFGKDGAIDNASKDGGLLDQLASKLGFGKEDKGLGAELKTAGARLSAFNDAFTNFFGNIDNNLTAFRLTVTEMVVKPLLNDLGSAFVAGWAVAQEATSQALSVLGATFSQGWSNLTSTVSTAWALITGGVSSLWADLKSQFGLGAATLVVKIGEGVSGIVNWFTQLPGRVIAATASLIGQLLSQGQQWMSNLLSGVVSGFVGVMVFFQGLPGRITGALPNVSSILTDAGRKVIDGFISGITSAFNRVKETLSSLTSLLPSWKGPAKRDKTILTNAGQLVMDGFIVGLESRYDAVRRTLGSFSSELGGMELAAPNIANIGMSAQLASAGVAGSNGGVVHNEFNYNAAPGSSLGAEEDLFRALDRPRGRMPWG